MIYWDDQVHPFFDTTCLIFQIYNLYCCFMLSKIFCRVFDFSTNKASTNNMLGVYFYLTRAEGLQNELIVWYSSRRPSVWRSERLSVQTFKHEYLYDPRTNHSQILFEVIGFGKGCIIVFRQIETESLFSVATDGQNGVSGVFLGYFYRIYFSLVGNKGKHKGLDDYRNSAWFDKTAELAALERKKKSQ